MAYDAFLKFETPGVDGESTDDKHKGEIEVSSFSWGVVHQQTIGSATGGGGSGRAALQDIHFTKDADKASSVLFQHCAVGTHFDKVTLSVRKAGGSQMEYLKYVMNTVFVSSYQIGSAHGQEAATEQFSLAFGKMGFDYTPQKPDGTPGASVHGGWDSLANKKF
jgi:type VI secretion system secreted protein Hcp